MCHDAVRKARAKTHAHAGYNVFEVVWLCQVKSLTKVRSKRPQDMKRRCCEGQVCGTASCGRERVRRCLCTHHATCNCSQTVGIGSQQNPKKASQYIGLFDITPVDEVTVVIPPTVIVQARDSC